jgi:hypothetical protein
VEKADLRLPNVSVARFPVVLGKLDLILATVPLTMAVPPLLQGMSMCLTPSTESASTMV